MKHIKPYNESIKHFLKPKSKDDIKKSLTGLNSAQIVNKIRKYNMDIYDIFSKEEVFNILEEITKDINKIVDKYTKDYNTDFFKKYIEKFPDKFTYDIELNKYYGDYILDTGEELTDEIIHNIYDEFYTESLIDLLCYNFKMDNYIELFEEFGGISEFVQNIIGDFIYDLENIGW
jgi:hypothetical protein